MLSYSCPSDSYRSDLLLRAKNLGRRSRIVSRVRIALIVMLVVFMPFFLVMKILVAAQVAALKIIRLIDIAIGMLFAFVGISVIFYLLIVIAIWINKMDKEQRFNKRVRQIVVKNWFLLGHNLGTLVVVVPLRFITAQFPIDLPENVARTASLYVL